MEKTKKFFQNPLVRKILIVTIIMATLSVFGYYLATHPEIVKTLLNLPPWLLATLTIGYLGAVGANAYVLHVSLKLLSKQASYGDNIALTSYSSIINFFGPLQSGPGARAVYLKAKYGVRIRDFFGVTILFYGFFALINCFILALAAVIQFRSWITFLIAFVCLIAGLVLAKILYKRVKKIRDALQSFKLQNINTWLIGLGAIFLIAATAFSYFFELLYVSSDINLWQVIIYTAAANLALFVSLTPGAIGFREAFLVLTSKLHGIDSTTIIAANIIDRAFYIVFLLVLFLVLILIGRRLGFSFSKAKTTQE